MNGRLSLICLVAVVVVAGAFGWNELVENWPRAPSRSELLLAGSCELPFEDGVKASPGDRCAVGLIAKRCKGLDQCFVNCFTTGKGVRVGGGCAHICNYELRKAWRAPDGIKACYGEGEKSELW